MIGIIEKVNTEKSYGFISNEEHRSQSHFVHFSSVVGEKVLFNGEPVEYEVRTGRRGKPAAFKVRPIWR